MIEGWNKVPCERHKILVIEPHSDDGVLSVEGIISKYCERGAHAVSIMEQLLLMILKNHGFLNILTTNV